MEEGEAHVMEVDQDEVDRRKAELEEEQRRQELLKRTMVRTGMRGTVL